MSLIAVIDGDTSVVIKFGPGFKFGDSIIITGYLTEMNQTNTKGSEQDIYTEAGKYLIDFGFCFIREENGPVPKELQFKSRSGADNLDVTYVPEGGPMHKTGAKLNQRAFEFVESLTRQAISKANLII